jgi:hypothetical protein
VFPFHFLFFISRLHCLTLHPIPVCVLSSRLLESDICMAR